MRENPTDATGIGSVTGMLAKSSALSGATSLAGSSRVPVANCQRCAKRSTNDAHRVAGEDGLHLVVRLVRLVLARHPPRIARDVRGGVPAILADVRAAHERDLPVDDRDLLMVRAAERDGAVRLELEAVDGRDVEDDLLEDLALEREEETVVPREHLHLELGALAAEPIEEREELVVLRVSAARDVVAAEQLDVAVELPAEDQDAALRARGRDVERAVVVLSVDEETRADVLVDAPRGFSCEKPTHAGARSRFCAAAERQGKTRRALRLRATAPRWLRRGVRPHARWPVRVRAAGAAR